MRFGAAVAVVLSHSYILTHNEPNSIPRSMGYLAVNCFFVMSGFLICKSVTERKSTAQFYIARILRIYPALVIGVLITIFVIGPLQTTGTLSEYFQDKQTYNFLVKNCLLIFGIEYHLPSVFTGVGVGAIVNAPLWTLVFEVYLYLFSGLLGALLLRKKHGNPKLFCWFVIVLSLFALIFHVYNITVQSFDSHLFRNSIRFAAFFGIGASFYVMRHSVKLSPWILIFLLFALVASIKLPVFHAAIMYPILAYTLLYAAYIPKGQLLKFNQVGDYSYGIYIFAYPIQQSFANYFPDISTLILFLASLATTLLLAMLSWHFVESKALQFKTRV